MLTKMEFLTNLSICKNYNYLVHVEINDYHLETISQKLPKLISITIGRKL
jgi:hypothetical protein